MKLENRRINFIPEFVHKENIRKQRMILITLITVIITLLCFAIYFIPQYKLFTLTNKLNNYDIELKYAKDELKLLNELELTQKSYNKKKDLVNELSKDEFDISILMTELNQAAPKEVIFSFFSVSGSEVAVKYTVNTPVEISQLVENLKKLDIFDKVSMPNVPIVDIKTDVVFNLKLNSKFIKENKVTTEGVSK